MLSINPMEQYIALMMKFKNLPYTTGQTTLSNEQITTNNIVVSTLNHTSIEAMGPILWRELFLNVHSKAELLAWKIKLPLYECACSSFYVMWESNNTPTFPLTFEWKYELKKAVNEKLGRPNIGLDTAKLIWRQEKAIHKDRQVPIVSSMSSKNLKRQVMCINTWLKSGFEVVLLQNSKEIKQYKPLLNNVRFVETNTKRPLIKDMVQYGMIINSDCEMYGIGPDNIDINSFYLRWNYREGRASREEEWGIDACYIDPDILPDDFDFMIGKPFWDYAVPAILINNSINLKINHIPWLHHLNHKLNWSQDDWHEGHNWVLKRFTGDYSSPSYRKSLDPEHTYNKQLGMWVKNES
jgi:hypothetical protein